MRSQRIDAIRGCAITGMILFHAHYLLVNLFKYEGVDFSPLFWYIVGRTVAITFIIVAGIAYRLFTVEKSLLTILTTSLRRAFILSIIAWGISLITFTWFYEQRILFGIIHFFALTAIISPFFIYFWTWNITIGITIFLLWFLVNQLPFSTNILFPIGFIDSSFYSADYYPLIPWFGYFLIGYGLMNFWRNNLILSRWLSWRNAWIQPFAWVGKYSLFLYIVHVPLLYLSLYWLHR